MPLPMPREKDLPEHVSALYDRVARLERRKAGGATGIVGLTWGTTPQAIAIGATHNFTSGWSITDGPQGNAGITVVSGQPHYAPGLYLTQYLIVVNFDVDGTEKLAHAITAGDAVTGQIRFTASFNDGSWYGISGFYYITTDTPAAFSVRYAGAPAGATLNAQVYNGSQMYVTRLGDVPS